MTYKIEKYCSSCEKEVVLKQGMCPECLDFLFDVSDTQEELTYAKRCGEDYSKLMIKNKIVPNGFMGVKIWEM